MQIKRLSLFVSVAAEGEDLLRALSFSCHPPPAFHPTLGPFRVSES